MIHLFGCGALGSQIAMLLASPDYRFGLWDDDRVEIQNLLTSAYWSHHIGALKVHALAEMMYRKTGALCSPCATTLASTPRVTGARLAIDTFDNSEARSFTTNLGIPTLHVGVSAERTGQITWNERYHIPESDFVRGQNPICTNHLGRTILRFTATVAAGIAEDYLIHGLQNDAVVTESMRVYR